MNKGILWSLIFLNCIFCSADKVFAQNDSSTAICQGLANLEYYFTGSSKYVPPNNGFIGDVWKSPDQIIIDYTKKGAQYQGGYSINDLKKCLPMQWMYYRFLLNHAALTRYSKEDMNKTKEQFDYLLTLDTSKNAEQSYKCYYDQFYAGSIHNLLRVIYADKSAWAKYQNLSKYSFLGEFHCGLAWYQPLKTGLAAYDQNAQPKYGLLDSNYNVVLQPKYDDAGSFSENKCVVKLNNKWGFINKQGVEITPIKYDEAGNFNKDRAPVEINNKYGFIDASGKEVIPLKFVNIVANSYFSDGLAAVAITKDSVTGIQMQYIGQDESRFKNAHYEDDPNNPGKKVMVGTEIDTIKIIKWGYINNVGNFIIKPRFDEVGYFHEGFAPVKVNGKWGFINTKGRTIAPFKYDTTGYFYENRAWVIQENLLDQPYSAKIGYIDSTGNEVIPLGEYNPAFLSIDMKTSAMVYIGNFHEGLAYISTSISSNNSNQIPSDYIYIDKDGNIISKDKYSAATDFNAGKALVRNMIEINTNETYKTFYIDKNGNRIQ